MVYKLKRSDPVGGPISVQLNWRRMDVQDAKKSQTPF